MEPPKRNLDVVISSVLIAETCYCYYGKQGVHILKDSKIHELPRQRAFTFLSYLCRYLYEQVYS